MRSDDVEAVLETLVSLHEAQSAHDVDAVLAAYAIDGYANLAGLRAYNEQLMEADAFRGREVDLAHAECFLFRDTALVRPVLYRTSGRTRSFSYHFKRSEQGWRIIDNNRSFVPGRAICTERMPATAGRVVEHRGVLWTAGAVLLRGVGAAGERSALTGPCTKAGRAVSPAASPWAPGRPARRRPSAT